MSFFKKSTNYFLTWEAPLVNHSYYDNETIIDGYIATIINFNRHPRVQYDCPHGGALITIGYDVNPSSIVDKIAKVEDFSCMPGHENANLERGANASYAVSFTLPKEKLLMLLASVNNTVRSPVNGTGGIDEKNLAHVQSELKKHLIEVSVNVLDRDNNKWYHLLTIKNHPHIYKALHCLDK